MKNWLTEKLGGFGLVVFFLVTIAILVFPMVMLNLPFWAISLIIIVVYFVPALTAPLWIAGLIGAICGPQDEWAIAYYIVFGIAALFFLIRFSILWKRS